MLENEIQAKIHKEGDEIKLEDFFNNGQPTENDNSTDSPADKNEEGNKPSQDGDPAEQKPKADNNPVEEDNLPFHKHPRFKALTEEKNELKGEVENLKKLLEEIKNNSQQKDDSNQNVEIPKWFQDAWGNDPQVWSAFQEYQQGLVSKLENDVEKKIIEKQQSKEQELNKWNSWIEGEITRLQEEGNKFDKNELLKVANEFRPIDEKTGYIDFNKSLAILQMQKNANDKSKEKTDIKKNIVSENKSGEPKKSDSYSSQDLRYRDWRDL